MEIVTFMDRYWRVVGNTGFNASLDRLKAGLVEAGFRDGQASAPSGGSLRSTSTRTAATAGSRSRPR